MSTCALYVIAARLVQAILSPALIRDSDRRPSIRLGASQHCAAIVVSRRGRRQACDCRGLGEKSAVMWHRTGGQVHDDAIDARKNSFSNLEPPYGIEP